MNMMNQLICESKPSEMKVLENLSVDEYYQTITTWIKLIDEKNKSVEKNNPDESEPGTRKRMKSGK
jgi:hypothetical protein